MQTILVTGGAGYIGSHIVDLLCEYGYDVIVFDNLSTGFEENINSKALFIKGDIVNESELDYVFNKFNINSVIHMAALKSPSKSAELHNLYMKNNIIGSLSLISHVIKYKVKKFIFSSTAAVYGNPEYNPVDEKHPLNPINYYGFTKLYID